MRSSRLDPRTRAIAAALALLAHSLLTLLMFYGNRPRDRVPEPELTFISMWPLPAPVVSAHPPAAFPQTPEGPRNDTEQDESPAGSATTEVTPSEAPAEPSSGVDWYAEAAKSIAGAGAGSQVRSFNEPPKKMRESCKPKPSSWEWSPQEEKYGLLPWPYVFVGNCVIALGFFTCVLDPMPANSHLLDDMLKREHPSSVPHPQHCE